MVMRKTSGLWARAVVAGNTQSIRKRAANFMSRSGYHKDRQDLEDRLKARGSTHALCAIFRQCSERSATPLLSRRYRLTTRCSYVRVTECRLGGRPICQEK